MQVTEDQGVLVKEEPGVEVPDNGDQQFAEERLPGCCVCGAPILLSEMNTLDRVCKDHGKLKHWLESWLSKKRNGKNPPARLPSNGERGPMLRMKDEDSSVSWATVLNKCTNPSEAD